MAGSYGNKNAVGADSGREPIFDNPIDLQNKVDEYFADCKLDNEPITITGLALFLGFASRQSFYDYEKKIEFSYIIKKARTRVENAYEKILHEGKPTGAIFALKNMGWQDKIDISETKIKKYQLLDGTEDGDTVEDE